MKDLIWYEKHRTKNLADMVLTKDQARFFNNCIQNQSIPHILLYGPAGAGKTTLAMILIDHCAGAALVLNASSTDRGVATIKGKVKQFAKGLIAGDRSNIILFDEADGLTQDSQLALKNTIEKYHKNCRFIFTANDLHRIVKPIYSRCMVFKFETLSKVKIKRLLANILTQERVDFNRKDIKTIIDGYYPDIRSMINNLQLASVGGKLDPFKALPTTDFEMIQTYITGGKLLALRNMWQNKHDFLWLYKWLFNYFVPVCIEEPDHKRECAVTIAEYLFRDKDIADKEINAAGCIAEMMSILEIEVDFNEPF